MPAERVVVRDVFGFSTAHRAEILSCIDRIEGAVRYTEDDAVVRFAIRRANPEKADDPIRLGHLDVFSSVMHAWTGSTKRADEMRARITEALGERVTFETRRTRTDKELGNESKRVRARGAKPDADAERAFFVAFGGYWRAEPWTKFPLNAVVELEAEDLGYAGAVFISPRQAVTVFPSVKEVTEFFTFLERGGIGPHPPMLTMAFAELAERPSAEQQAFRDAGYDLAAPDAYPVGRFVTSMKPERPSMHDLGWLEVVALALTHLARGMADLDAWAELRSRAIEIRTHHETAAVRVSPINEHAEPPVTTVETVKIQEEFILKKTGARTMDQCVRWVRQDAANLGRN